MEKEWTVLENKAVELLESEFRRNGITRRMVLSFLTKNRDEFLRCLGMFSGVELVQISDDIKLYLEMSSKVDTLMKDVRKRLDSYIEKSGGMACLR